MPTLEEYLSSNYLSHKQEISGLDASINAAARTFIDTQSADGWPYQHRFSDEAAKPDGMSVGTTAMVLVSIGRMLGKHAFGEEGVPVHIDQDVTDKLIKAFDHGVSALSAELTKTKKVASGTFGVDNPLTTSHIAELIHCLRSGSKSPFASNLDKAIGTAKTHLNAILLRGPDERLIDASFGEYQRNAFIPLRAIRASKALKFNSDYNRWRQYFEANLHEQLSFSAIPDSRFDPAELVFSLEGLLLCAEYAVDAASMHRVIEVLAEKQNTSSHWRPSKPFLASGTGAIVLPISVEVANSLTRSIALMDEGRQHDTYSSKALPLLHRFWAWIQARAVRSSDQRESARLGWHSEHANVPDLVHTWDTSQVVEFMAGYRALQTREISRTSLRLSGLVSKKAPLRNGTATEAWTKAALNFDSNPHADPASGALSVPDDAVYSQIGRHFVDGWAAGSPANFSMLLYGPPGTGKTSVAKELSKALQMPLITVTVSDFLGAGGTNVEARAKAIFQTLEHQPDTIILFDEIDSFLLDRDSTFYRDQDSLFQFLTPGMLPKIHDLRDSKGCIFIIATNYENRIDPAIKRTGRIDHAYLVSLPNAVKRKAILVKEGLDPAAINSRTLSASVFLGYGDLAKVAREYRSRPLPAASTAQIQYMDQLVADLKGVQRASSLAAYLNRVEAIPADFSAREFEDMVRLADEAGAGDVLHNAKLVVDRLAGKRDLRSLLNAETIDALGPPASETSPTGSA